MLEESIEWLLIINSDNTSEEEKCNEGRKTPTNLGVNNSCF
jgi:hypothetical protein